uniref:RNA1 polyprotein n=1 Tax=Gentiana ecaudata nepovirus TaxID=3115767 RepID=A0AAT9J7U9_9SECO
MGWFCPNGQCVERKTIFSNREFKEVKGFCPGPLCQSLLQKGVPPPRPDVTQKEIINKPLNKFVEINVNHTMVSVDVPLASSLKETVEVVKASESVYLHTKERFVPKLGENLELAGAKIKLQKAENQRQRALRRQEVCKRIRKERARRIGQEYMPLCTETVDGLFFFPLPPSQGCMGSVKHENKIKLPCRDKSKTKSKIWRAVVPSKKDWTVEEENLVSACALERTQCASFDDEDCVIVPRVATKPQQSKFGSVPVVENLEQALSFIEEFWNIRNYTSSLKARVQEMWDEGEVDKLALGLFCACLIELEDPELSPILEGNFFILSKEDQYMMGDINTLLLDECRQLEGLAVVARGNMFQFAKATARAIASKVASAVTFTTDTIVDFVMKQVRKIFDQILGPWLSPFKHLVEQVNTMWSKVRAWALKIQESTPAALKVLKEHAFMAFAAIVVGGVVLLVENTLKSLGVLNKVGATLGLFLTLFISSLGVSGIVACHEQVAELHKAFKIGVCTMVCPGGDQSSNLEVPGNEHIAEARSLIGLDTAIKSLMDFGKSLISFKLGTLQYYAKMGQSFDQLVKGKKAIEELAAWTIDIVGDIYNKMTGNCSQFFDELSALVCCDVRMWLRSSQRVRLDALITPGSRNVLEIVEKLLETGQKLKIGASGVSRKFSLDFTSTICREVEKLEEVRNQLANAGAYKGTRFYPFWVYVVGPSQCGKTNFVSQYLAPGLLDKMDCAIDSQYSKGKQDAYWSDYKRQALVKIDDMYAIKSAEIEPMMIDMVNSEPFPLNMAALADKGRLFDSPLVITTCNDLHPPSDCDLRDKPSFYNRRAVVVEMRRKAGSVYNPADTNDCTECRLLDPKVSQLEEDNYDALHHPITEWISVKEATARIETLLLEHKVREEIRINAVNEAQRGNSGIMCFSKQYVLEQRLTGIFLDTPTKERYDIDSKCFMFLVVDGIVYQQDAGGHVFELSRQPKIPEKDLLKMEERCVTNVVYNIQAYLADGPPNALVGTFLAHIIDETCNVKSINGLSSAASAGELEFWDSLQTDLRGRVYLRLCQKRKDSIAGETKDALIDKTMAKLLKFVGDSYQYVRNNGGTLCLLLAGFVTITATFYGLFSFMSNFFTATNVVSGIAALEAVEAKSVMSSSSYGDAYAKKRNLAPLHHYIARGAVEDYKEPWQRMSVKIFPEAGPARGKIVMACQYYGRSLLLTRHQAQSIPHGSQVYVEYTDLPGVYLFWDHVKDFQEIEGRELLIYRNPALHALSGASKKLFLHDSEKKLSPYMRVNRFGYRYNSEDGQIYVKKQDGMNATTIRETLAVRRSSGGYTYERLVDRFLKVDGIALDDDCGTLVSTMISGQQRIVGILVGGSGVSFSADIIPEIFECETKSDVRIIEEFGIQEPGYAKIGMLDNAQRPTMPTSTQYVLVPEEIRFPVENCKEPAVLSDKDPRLLNVGKVYNPLREGLKKYANPMGRLEEPLLREVAADIVQTWYDCQSDFLEDVELGVAINGEDFEKFFDPMVMSTSEGYPFVLERKQGEAGKERYFVGLPGERELKPGTSVEAAYLDLCAVAPHSVPELYCMECPKDERLPKRKIYDEPKTRLFAILPLHFNLRFRVKFLSFCQFIQSNRHTLPCQVGINPYSREWKEIFHRLGQYSSEAYNCDYSSFDGLMTHQVLNSIADMINLMYSAQETEEAKNERKNLLLSIWGRKCIAGTQVYQVNAGIPSGCALTVLLNSIFNEILVRYAFKKMIPGVARSQFSSFVCLLVYGDDNLISVRQAVSQVEITVVVEGKEQKKNVSFGQALKTTLASIGVNITDGTDKLSPTLEAKPLVNLDFLKRGFKRVDGYILAPLDKNAILSSLVWVAAKDGDVLEKLRQNVVTALREIWLHQDREYYNGLRGFYVSNIPAWTNLPVWDVMRAFHIEQLTTWKPWQPAKNIDILVNPEMFTFMDCHGYADEKFTICDRVFVAGPKYRFEPDEFGISLTNTLKGENALNCVLCRMDDELPTKVWAESWRTSLNPNVSRARAAYDAGKKLVFRGNAPYISCWIAMIKFCTAYNICDKDTLLALFYNLKGNRSADLSSYFSQFDMTKRLGYKTLPRPIYVATNDAIVIEHADSVFHGVISLANTQEFQAEESSVKETIGIKAKAIREGVGSFPLLVEHSGLSILEEGRYPGALIDIVLKEDPQFVHKNFGRCAVVTAFAILYCDDKCLGHVRGNSVGCRIVENEKQIRHDLTGVAQFCTFNGMYSDDTALKLSKVFPRLGVFDHLRISNCYR